MLEFYGKALAGHAVSVSSLLSLLSQTTRRLTGPPCAEPAGQISGLTLRAARTCCWIKFGDVRVQRLNKYGGTVRQLMRSPLRIRIGDVSTGDGKLSFI
jgi:hypothetical protein